jgi:hypothetical protein
VANEESAYAALPNTEKQHVLPRSNAPGIGLGRAQLALERDLASGHQNRFQTKERTHMKKHLSKKRVVLAAIVVVALAIASGVAYAYFTATGAGSGTVGVGNATAIVLTPTITGPLVPGGTPATVSVTVTNNGAGSQYVGSVHLASITPDSTAPHNLCTTAYGGFSMVDIPVNQTLTRSGTPGNHATVTGALAMADTGSSQDSCQGATLTLNLTSN